MIILWSCGNRKKPKVMTLEIDSAWETEQKPGILGPWLANSELDLKL